MTIKENIRKTFLELISIDGIYPYEDKVIEYVEKRLTAAGVPWQEDSFRNIIVKIPGQGQPILLSTHLDIPEPTPLVKYLEKGDVIEADGTCILGADPKTGLAILIEFFCDQIKQDPKLRLPVEAVLTRGEETGLFGSRNCDFSLLSAKMGLVLDEDGPVTQVVTQAPAFVRVDAEFVGKIVHPREPENGVNALQAAFAAMTSLPWGYIAKGVTWNVGIFQSGTARNSVPGSAKLQAELRSYDTKSVVAQGQRVVDAFNKAAKDIGATCKIETELEFEGYKLDQATKLFEKLNKTFAAMSLKPNYFSTFGGSDANIFNSNGIVTVPIGSGYYNAHQYTEQANLKDMEEIYRFLEKFVRV